MKCPLGQVAAVKAWANTPCFNSQSVPLPLSCSGKGQQPTLARMKRFLPAWCLFGGLMAAGVAQAQAIPLPPFSHVFMFVLENSSSERIVGNKHMPELNRLAEEGAVALNDHGVTHPSLPNYVALISGSFFGTHSDNANQQFHGPTLPDELEAAGLTWKGYFQSMPSAGFKGNFGGPYWVYVKRHNPFMLFPAIANDPQRAANSVPLAQLKADLNAGKAPNFALIVPDLCHDLHGSLNCFNKGALYARADSFLAEWVGAIRASRAWDDRAAIVITFDESEGKDSRGGGGRISTIVLTKNGPSAYKTETNYNHYSLLRTLTDAWRLPPLGEAAKAAPMTELFVKP